MLSTVAIMVGPKVAFVQRLHYTFTKILPTRVAGF